MCRLRWLREANPPRTFGLGLSPRRRAIAFVTEPQLLAPVYQGIALLAQRLKSDEATALLAALGDVKLFRLYANCFGKQNLTDFQAAAVAASQGKMFEEGRSKELKIDPNAFTLLQLLHLLAGDPENLFVPSAMNYRRVSRAMMEAFEGLVPPAKCFEPAPAKVETEAEQAAMKARCAAIAAPSPEKLYFCNDEVPGYPVANLTWNETRANVSLLVKITGSIALPPDAPPGVPRIFPTHIWRNFTIIRDGIANIEKLPVRLSSATFQALKAAGVVSADCARSPRSTARWSAM
jgi:hypothetical protein